jgi:hypothetical protein
MKEILHSARNLEKEINHFNAVSIKDYLFKLDEATFQPK